MDFIGHEARIPNPALRGFAPFIGTWTTTGTHPMMPGTTFHGRCSFEWHEGGAFVLMRTEIVEPEVPSGIAVFGSDDEGKALSMIYFDEREVSRRYEATLTADGVRWERMTESFSQRFVVTRSADGATMHGTGEMSKDGGAWEGDLELRYTRVR